MAFLIRAGGVVAAGPTGRSRPPGSLELGQASGVPWTMGGQKHLPGLRASEQKTLHKKCQVAKQQNHCQDLLALSFGRRLAQTGSGPCVLQAQGHQWSPHFIQEFLGPISVIASLVLPAPPLLYLEAWGAEGLLASRPDSG